MIFLQRNICKTCRKFCFDNGRQGLEHMSLFNVGWTDKIYVWQKQALQTLPIVLFVKWLTMFRTNAYFPMSGEVTHYFCRKILDIFSILLCFKTIDKVLNKLLFSASAKLCNCLCLQIWMNKVVCDVGYWRWVCEFVNVWCTMWSGICVIFVSIACKFKYSIRWKSDSEWIAVWFNVNIWIWQSHRL